MKKKKIVFLTGAGMSVESGFKTFRGSDGLWESYPVEQVASHEGWLANPNLVNGFYNGLRKKLCTAQPNEGHLLVAALQEDFDVIVVTAEPALTAAKMAKDTISAIAVNDLFRQATGEDGYAQAALFVKAETAETQPETVAAFLKQAEEACASCTTEIETVAAAAEQLEILKNAKVAAKAIPGCAIRYVAAAEAKALIEKTAQIDLSQFGGEVPADDFYYGAE